MSSAARFRERLRRFRPPPRVTKWLRRAVLAVLGLYVFYLVAANVFLGFHLLDRVATSEDGTVELRTGRAWTFVPGRASVRDFVLRLDNDDLQLRLTVARATTSIDLFRLLRREVRLSDVEASGVSFRLRMRVESIPKEDEERIAAYPEIEGALGPPLLSAAKVVPKGPVEDAWHVDIGSANVDVNEVWIQEYRVTGAIHAAGGFALWPGKDFALRPSSTEIHGATVRVGAHVLTRDLELFEGRAEIHALSLRDTRGAAVLDYLVGSARGTSTLEDASFLSVYPGEWIPRMHVEPSPSAFDARFVMGKFVTGTNATMQVRGARVSLPGVAIAGPSFVHVEVPRDGEMELGGDSGESTLVIDALPSTARAPWIVRGARVRQTIHVVVGEPVTVGTGRYRGEVRTPSLGWFDDIAKLGVSSRGRSIGTVDLTRETDGTIHGPFSARIENGVIAGDTMTVGVSSSTKGELALEPNPKRGITISRVTVDAPNASVQAKGKDPYSTWVHVDVPKLTIKTEPRFELNVAADARAGTGGLVAGVVESKAGLVLGPIAAHFLDKEGMDARAGVSVVDSEVLVDVVRSEVGSVTAKGFWSRRSQHTKLAMVLFHPPLSVGVRIDEGFPLVLPTVGDDWLASQKP